MQPPIAEAPALRGQLPEPPAKLRVIPTDGLVAIYTRINARQATGPPLRVTLLLHGPVHGSPPGTGPQKFFPSISFSVDTSIMDSASSFFASDTSMPPYLERHL